MSKLTSKRQYETGSSLQVLDPLQLHALDIIQIDSVRKPRPKSIRMARAIGAFLTAGQTEGELTRRDRVRQTWQANGLLTEGAIRGIIISLTATSLTLQVRDFDFDPEHPAHPMAVPPVTAELSPLVRPPKRSDFTTYDFQDIGLATIRPNQTGQSDYHTRDEIGRYSLAVVHRMFEPIVLDGGEHRST